MNRRPKEYPYGYDRAPLDPETLVTAIAVVENMSDETPDWLDEEGVLGNISSRIREKALNLAHGERLIRSVGILATLDEIKLEELVQAKKDEKEEVEA